MAWRAFGGGLELGQRCGLRQTGVLAFAAFAAQTIKGNSDFRANFDVDRAPSRQSILRGIGGAAFFIFSLANGADVRVTGHLFKREIRVTGPAKAMALDLLVSSCR
ncbi:hypothetical protein [Saccharopolyspora sp. ASAGF58]|uniref:hypothetical protein n=1 Tax=Saccharopolyspora sp. ASAGF58 TaxID=2719023 RepID=UPI00143FD5AC|nr:hypothetical protein [Saccharopolyspora sp. ASAGF58]QIZ37429.1 hypothetical protein FDZ84_26090 [Saccharopolyspora sp. ASAGF58]